MDKSVNNDGKLIIKKERINEDIKEFAETAMNELLGWYGYTNKDSAKMLTTCRSNSNSSDGTDSPKFHDGCGWCGKSVDDSNGLSSGTATFCSELCFSQSRRANFKKNKTCDWCRHVRHTVSYVDFQDGESQLQFCSDKCLNQYKMHIFCRETRAHLEMHPHLIADESTAGLITPDLWMKNCKSPPHNSKTPSPIHIDESLPQTSPLPLITVAHPSKLLASPPEQRAKPAKRLRKRIPSTITASNFHKASNDLPQDLRVRHSPIVELPPTTTPVAVAAPAANNQRVVAQPNLLPPVTVMVPYPVLIPLPIPIPIPLPLTCFAKAAELKLKLDASQTNQSHKTVNSSHQCSNSNEEKEDDDETEIIVDDVKEVVKCSPSPIRPPRKRKRVVDSKIIKTKKTLSV